MENIQINIAKDGTTTLATAGKYCDRNIDVNVSGMNLVEVHEITVDSTLTSGVVTLLSGSEFIKNNHTKMGFQIQLISQSTKQGERAIAYAFNGKKSLVYTGTSYVYGYVMCSGVSSLTHVVSPGSCTTSNTNGVPYVNSSGDVLIYTNANNTPLTAGKYHIVLAVVE